jgi:hypothetical protein
MGADQSAEMLGSAIRGEPKKAQQSADIYLIYRETVKVKSL